MTKNAIIRARRLALSRIIAEGGLPSINQFRRAGLPPLVPASEMLAVTQQLNAEVAAKVQRHTRRLPGPAF